MRLRAGPLLAGGGRSRVPALPGLSAAIGLLLGSAALALVLQRYPPSWLVVLAGSIGLTCVVALAIARYELAVALGVVLLSVVKVEPAPPDAVFAVVIAVAAVTGRFHIERAPLSILAIVGAFLFLNVLSAMEATDPTAAGRYMTITLYLVVFALWLADYLNSEWRARGIVIAYLITALASAIVASAALNLGFGGTLFADYDRARGLFEDPNVYGPFLVPIALIVVDEIVKPKLLKIHVSLKMLALAILLIGVLFSYSRGAYVSFALGLIVLLGVSAVRRRGGRRAAGVLVALVFAGIVLAGVVTATGSLDFLQQRAQAQNYDVERFAAQRKGLEYGEEKPIGIGPGQFEVLEAVVSHNSFVRTLSEQGFLGLILFTALMLTTLGLGMQSAVLGRDTWGIGSAPLLGAWIGISFQSFFVDTLHWRHLWLVAALIWAGAMRRTE